MSKSYTLNELATLVGGEVAGDGNLSITSLNGVEYVTEGEITFITNRKKAIELADCKASAAIVPLDCDNIDLPCIKVGNPSLSAAVIHNYLLEKEFVAGGVHPTACVGQDCSIPDDVTIGPMVCIGDRVKIGEKVVCYPGVVIGDDCVIGDATILRANVSVAEETTIGNRVIIHSGASIGSDGFGYATDQYGNHVKKPQVGNVLIGDDVEIGANSCVDRAAFGTTHVRSGTKIDNLVMVAHNVDVGENTILVAQSGVAGSTKLGRNVVVGGQAAVAGHLNLGDQAMVAGKSGVHADVKGGQAVGGYPAFDLAKWRKSSISFGRLPEMRKEIRALRKQLNELTEKLQNVDKRIDQEGEE